MERNKRNTNILKNKKIGIYDIIVFSIIFIASVCISLNTELYLDDFTYKQAGVCGFNEIIRFLKWHISNYNGRTLIHFMEMMTLRYDFGFTVWKIFTGVLLCIFCFISAKITTVEKKDFSKATILTAICFFGVNPALWNESVFWLSGSFNYFIPTMMFFGLMLLVRYRPKSNWIFPVCFICGATTEQVGMVTFGFFVILFLEHLIRTRKISTRNLACCILSIVGYATVLLSPGTSSRLDTQSELDFKMFFENIVTIFQDNWFANFNLFVMIVMTTVCISYWLIKYRRSNKVLSKAVVPMLIVLWILTVFNIGIKGISILNEVFGLDIVFSKTINTLVFAVWLAYAFVYFVGFFLATVLIYVKKKDCFPFAFFVLGFGSQLMMSVAGRSYFRTCLAMWFMIILFEVYSYIKMWNDFKKTELFKRKEKLFNPMKIKGFSVVLLAVLCSAFIALEIPNLYKTEESLVNVEFSALDEEGLKEFTDGLVEDNIEYYSDPESDWNKRKDILDFSKY